MATRTILYQRWKPLARLSLMKKVCEKTKPCCSSPKKIGPSRPGHTCCTMQKGSFRSIQYIGMCALDTKTLWGRYLTAEAAHAGLADHAEQLRLSGMLVAQEAYARFVVNAHKAGVSCRKWSASLQGEVKGKHTLQKLRKLSFSSDCKLGRYARLNKWEESRFSHHTFLPSVWQSCWPSWSALLLPGHHRDPCPLLGSGHLPARGKVTEGAVPRCKTTSWGHGAHKSDRGPPVHSSERQEYRFISLIVCFESAKKEEEDKTTKYDTIASGTSLLPFHVNVQLSVNFRFVVLHRRDMVAFRKWYRNTLTSPEQSESTNVWCSKPLRENTFAWSQNPHLLKT